MFTKKFHLFPKGQKDGNVTKVAVTTHHTAYGTSYKTFKKNELRI